MLRRIMCGSGGFPGRRLVVGRALRAFGFLSLLCLLRGAVYAESEAPPQDSTAAVIRTIVDAAQQPLLQHPDFTEQQDSVRRLYEPRNFQPLWLQGGKPSRQAGEIIGTLSEADRRGL